MTIQDAVRSGIEVLRRPMWANATCYMRIHLFGGGCGPWAELWDRRCQETIGEPTPQRFLNIGDTTSDYEEYTGPLDETDLGGRRKA